MIFDHSSSRKFFESKFLISLQFIPTLWILPKTSITKCSLSICQFFAKWSLFPSEQFMPCSSMPNCHCLRINLTLQFTNIILGQDPLCTHVAGSRFLLLRAIVLPHFPKWSWTDCCLTLRQIFAFVTSSWRVSCTCWNWLTAPWNKLSLLRVTNLQQARTCFSLLKVQWWSQRFPGVLVVNLSIWVLSRHCRQGCRLSWHSGPGRISYFLKVFSQFSSWKFLDLEHVTLLQFFHVSHIPDASFTVIPILFWSFFFGW